MVYFAFLGLTGTVRALIALRADVNSQDNKGMTPLHMAVAKNSNSNSKTVQALIDAGADVNSQDKKGMTPLKLSALHSKATKNIMSLEQPGFTKEIQQILRDAQKTQSAAATNDSKNHPGCLPCRSCTIM
jgi:hypothetical protein